MRQWAYMTFGDEKAIEFVAMATRDDLNANAEFIRLADTFVEVPSGSNKNNYANVDLIVNIAVSQKVNDINDINYIIDISISSIWCAYILFFVSSYLKQSYHHTMISSFNL